jgi:hypothetical protein
MKCSWVWHKMSILEKITRVVLESSTVVKNEQLLSLMIVHVNIKSFQYARVVLIKVLIDLSKY